MPKRIKTFSPGGGALVLTLSSVLSKLSGMLFKIPLSHLLSDGSMGYFTSAYTVYTFFYTVSALGIAQALSLLISSADCEKNGSIKSERIYKTAETMMLVSGIVLSGMMFFFSDKLAELTDNPGCALSVAAISPVVLFSCIGGVRRGFFQGRNNMLPTAVSQIIEASGKVVFGLALAYYAAINGYPERAVPAFAIAGIAVAHMLSCLYLVGKKRKTGLCAVAAASDVMPYGSAVNKIISALVPITVSSLIVSFTNVIDLSMIMNRLRDVGYSGSQANALYGNYSGLVVPLFSLPLSFISPVCLSTLPLISAAVSEGRYEDGEKLSRGALRSALIISLPCSFGFAALGKPILALIYGKARAESGFATLALISLSLAFNALSIVQTAICQAYKKGIVPVISMSLGCILKTVSGYFLIARFGIYGAPLSSIICYISTTALNFALFPRGIMKNADLIRGVVLPLLSALASAASAYFVYGRLSALIGDNVACLSAVFFAAVVYALLIMIAGVFDTETLYVFPGGKLIKKYIGSK